MKAVIPLIARIFIAQIFLVAGFGKVMQPAYYMEYMTSHGMPFAAFFLFGAIVVELGGGLSLLFGFLTRLGATALFLFLIPTTLIFHTAFSDPVQQIMFMKNLAIMGGLLMLAQHGSGWISVDAFLKRRGMEEIGGVTPEHA
jgi:putative oxidoreductase